MAETGVNQVARAAGVSIATVSRVINQPELVAPSTRDRVTEAMERLNYHVNTAASSLRRGHAKTISLVVASMSQPWYVKLVRALRQEISIRGYATMIYDLEHNSQTLVKYLDTVQHQGVSGIILATGDFVDSPEVVAAITKAHQTTPIVVIGQHIEDAPWPTIQFNDVKGSYEATKVLLDQSPGPVAFLGRLKNSYLAGERLKGYRLAIEDQYEPTTMAEIWDISDFDYAAGHREVTKALRSGSVPRAILCVNDELALGALRAVADYGLRTPEDVRVMGYGNTDFLEYVLPSLSSVDGSAVSAASVGLTALWARLEGKSTQPLTILERKIVLRESTGHHHLVQSHNH